MQNTKNNSQKDSISRKQINEFASQQDQEILLADGFEDAFLGIVPRFHMEPVALYDRGKCIKILMKRDGMTRDDAEEFFVFNVEEAWVGNKTPAFVVLMT